LGNTNEFFLEDISFLPEKKVIGFQMNQKEGSQAAKPASFTWLHSSEGWRCWNGQFHVMQVQPHLVHEVRGKLDLTQKASLNNQLSTCEMQRRCLNLD